MQLLKHKIIVKILGSVRLMFSIQSIGIDLFRKKKRLIMGKKNFLRWQNERL